MHVHQRIFLMINVNNNYTFMPYHFCHLQKSLLYDMTAISIRVFWILMVTLTIGSQILSSF